jgi:hypothetical protein
LVNTPVVSTPIPPTKAPQSPTVPSTSIPVTKVPVVINSPSPVLPHTGQPQSKDYTEMFILALALVAVSGGLLIRRFRTKI